MDFDYLPLDLLTSIHWEWFWLIENPYPAVSEHITEEEAPTAEPKGTDIMGEGFATPDSASPVTDIHKVTMFFVIFMIWQQV